MTFRIFANKRQTTVTMNQILTQNWFLLQNIKDSSWDRNGVFNNGEWTCLAELCNLKYFRASRASGCLDSDIRLYFQGLLWSK
jgi:hypothetical protein